MRSIQTALTMRPFLNGHNTDDKAHLVLKDVPVEGQQMEMEGR